jgi:hypothetical protein
MLSILKHLYRRSFIRNRCIGTVAGPCHLPFMDCKNASLRTGLSHGQFVLRLSSPHDRPPSQVRHSVPPNQPLDATLWYFWLIRNQAVVPPFAHHYHTVSLVSPLDYYIVVFLAYAHNQGAPKSSRPSPQCAASTAPRLLHCGIFSLCT